MFGQILRHLCAFSRARLGSDNNHLVAINRVTDSVFKMQRWKFVKCVCIFHSLFHYTTGKHTRFIA
jgi:hypothetical protein